MSGPLKIHRVLKKVPGLYHDYIISYNLLVRSSPSLDYLT
jgi:hypothetical protein